MEYEIESLITDLGLPRDVIQEDVEKGRLLVNQHRGDDRSYVDAEIFLDYAAARVPELARGERRAFWLAAKKMVTDPAAVPTLSGEELQAVLAGIEREIASCT